MIDKREMSEWRGTRVRRGKAGGERRRGEEGSERRGSEERGGERDIETEGESGGEDGWTDTEIDRQRQWGDIFKSQGRADGL